MLALSLPFGHGARRSMFSFRLSRGLGLESSLQFGRGALQALLRFSAKFRLSACKGSWLALPPGWVGVAFAHAARPRSRLAHLLSGCALFDLLPSGGCSCRRQSLAQLHACLSSRGASIGGDGWSVGRHRATLRNRSGSPAGA